MFVTRYIEYNIDIINTMDISYLTLLNSEKFIILHLRLI